jgi:CelD/BcsL family acetyltransferase involved in cellulose biosynthesis
VSVYNQSWKQEEPFPHFIPELLRLASRRGWLRLGIAHHDGRPVAGQVWLVCDNTAYIFKLAHAEDYKHLSPGTVLTAFMMEHVVDKDRVKKIDFLSGDDEYKRDWMSTRGDQAGIAAFNPATVRGCAMLAVRWVRSLPGAKRVRGDRQSA